MVPPGGNPNTRVAWRELSGGEGKSERPLVLLLFVVRRHSTTDDGLLLRRQIHDRKLTVLAAADAYSDESRTHDLGERTEGHLSGWQGCIGVGAAAVRRGLRLAFR